MAEHELQDRLQETPGDGPRIEPWLGGRCGFVTSR
jgi:hypothetical protein